MAILAIDPGVKNMAVAAVHGTSILTWDLVDLVPSVRKPGIERIVRGIIGAN